MKIHDGHPTWREGTPAIGTFVEADVPDGHKQIRQVDGGNGHSGQRSPEIRIGLGPHDRFRDSVENCLAGFPWCGAS